MGETTVRVLSSDEGFAAALRSYLAAQPTIKLVTTSPVEVLVLIGIPIASISGHHLDETALLVIGPNDSEEMITALEAGALGYLPQPCAFEDINRAVMAVAGGEAVVPPYMLGALLRHVVHRRRANQADLERLSQLTEREREVFDLMALGLDREAIAARLFISVGTVRTHLQRLFRKLDIHTHAEVVAIAARCGLNLVPEGDMRL
jgi:DNA-binding NarL/FixJ family response regulator